MIKAFLWEFKASPQQLQLLAIETQCANYELFAKTIVETCLALNVTRFHSIMRA